jgi:hypothetical protein
MDDDKRLMMKKHLAEIDGQITEGERHLERQREAVWKCLRVQSDATQAFDLLVTMEQLQRLRIEERDRLKAALADASETPP